MIVTYTAEQWRAFQSGREVMDDLKAKGIRNPRAARQAPGPDGSITFEEE